MKTFPVYRIDKVRERKVRVGTLVERRGTERGNNIAGLLKLAANQFKVLPGQTIQIEITPLLTFTIGWSKSA